MKNKNNQNKLVNNLKIVKINYKIMIKVKNNNYNKKKNKLIN